MPKVRPSGPNLVYAILVRSSVGGTQMPPPRVSNEAHARKAHEAEAHTQTIQLIAPIPPLVSNTFELPSITLGPHMPTASPEFKYT